MATPSSSTRQPYGLIAAILVSSALVLLALAEVTVGALQFLGGWPLLPDLINLAITAVAFAFGVAAAVDAWLALRPTRRRAPRSYLGTARSLLVLACLLGGPFVAVPILPGLVFTWLAYARSCDEGHADGVAANGRHA